MHIPLIIAVLAVTALALLPVLDRAAGIDIDARGITALVGRIARWAQE